VPSAHRPLALRGKVFRKRDVVATGLLTTDALRSSAWRRLYRGVYADAALPDTFGLRVSGAALLVPAAAAFSGRTAAFLHGAETLADVRMPVEISVPAGVRFGPVTGLIVRHAVLPDGDVTRVRDRRCTTRIRTALDIARTGSLSEAVVALDVLLARHIVEAGELREAAAALAPRRGCRKALKAVGLADGRAESPPESRLRVLLAEAGLPAVPQFTVRGSDGAFAARVDLAYPAQRVAVEYDGYWHAEGGQFSKDRQRLNRLAAAGWTVVHVTASDLRDPAALVAQIRALLRARNFGEVGV
jgi:very-short-patch-repair endonuclease